MSDSVPDEVTIEFRQVGYHVNGRPLIGDFNLEVRRGETVVLLGRTGSGKTTILKLINQLLTPSHGAVLVEGRSTQEWDVIQLRRHIGYVIQETGLFPHFTVERNVGTVPRLQGWAAARVRERVEEMLSLVGLEPPDFRNRYPHELSGGQRQRVGVARALAGDPPIILMDEPFGALDPITRAETQREFTALKRRVRKTIVLVTHDLHEALKLADRIALIEGGKLVGVYSPAEFLRSTQPAVVQYVNAYKQ
jgi:osmoprotectant transport system ATP-binding protein